MRILLTNDDGVQAPGLRALRTELQKLGDVIVVAPATEQSAVGHSITLSTPLIDQRIVVQSPGGEMYDPATCCAVASETKMFSLVTGAGGY